MAEDATPVSQRERWDRRHAEAPEIGPPAEVLLRNAHLLPASGKALDLACGRGANALWLAQCTALAVEAWDFSPVAIARLAGAAALHGLRVDAVVRDVVARPPAPGCCDVLVVTHFLERDLVPALRVAVRPGGLLVYQTFTREAVSARGPSTPQLRLAPNELLGLFTGFIVRAYREEGVIGNPERGLRDVAYLVAQRAP